MALSYVLFEEAIDLAELYSQVLGRRVMLKLREDSEACAKVVSTGYSRKLRHLKRTHKVNIAAVKEQLDRDDTQLELVNTTRQKADVSTKALQTAKWPAAMSLMGLTMSQYRILTSTNTGFKAERRRCNRSFAAGRARLPCTAATNGAKGAQNACPTCTANPTLQ